VLIYSTTTTPVAYPALPASKHRSTSLETMAELADPSGHAAVVNITTRTVLPPGYEYLPASSSTAQLVFCRTLTSAQGRILYNLWDADDDRLLVGYVIPSHIIAESWKLPKKSAQEDWAKLPYHQRQRLLVVWEMISKLFPRIPVFAARKIAERMVRLRNVASKVTVEEVVLEYALQEFMPYLTRLESSGVEEGDLLRRYEAESQAKAASRMKLGEVLTSWLPDDSTTDQELDFCRRHELLTRKESSMAGIPDFTSFGGNETVANLCF
jgi:hypothetical protein